MIRELRKGKFYWKSATGYKVNNYRRADRVYYDAVIVGAGISGALAALKLSRSGYKVCVIDKHIPGKASTLACTAILQYDTDLLLHQLREKIGRKNADLVYTCGIGAIKEIEKISRESKISVEYHNRDSLLLAFDEDDSDVLKQEFLARRQIGLDVTFLSREEMERNYPFKAESGLLSKNAAEVNPLLLTESILVMANEQGVDIYTDCEYFDHHDDGDSIVVNCSDRQSFITSKLVIACGYLSSKTLGGTPLGKLTSSFAGATSVIDEGIKGWKNSEVVWEVARPYVYMRKTEDGRVIIGGRDKPFRNVFMRDLFMPFEKQCLTKKAEDLLGLDNIELEYFWSGTFGESDDSLPFIGPAPDKKNIFVIMGTGGNGITFSVFASEILCDWVKGRQSDLARLCRLDREI